MSKRTLYVLGAAAIILVAGFFLWLNPQLSAQAVTLPVLGNPGHRIADFSFLNQQGKTINRDSVAGKVCVVEYFFTTCPVICPRMNAAMSKIYDEFKDDPGFLILSHTVDPSHDSVPVLEKYAERYHADPRVWMFLTGPKKELYAMARQSYLLDSGGGDGGDDDFVHTQMWVLVDRQGRLRGFYDSLVPDQVKKLEKDLNFLLAAR
jgi:protein SCO1/2